MIKVKLAELFKHRNETTFRPYLMAKNLFEDIGVQFVTEGKCDLTWVAQASFNDKKNFETYTYGNVISRGLHYLETEIEGDYVLFDGQDSASLIGSFDVFKNSKAKLLFKNSLYADRNDYLKPWKMGRSYWGLGEPLLNLNQKNTESFGYAIREDEIDTLKKVQLSGCNWLSTINPVWYDTSKLHKDIDVFAMFSYPAKVNWEFGCLTNLDYDLHRKKCIEELDKLPKNITVAKLEDGKKVPIEYYYNLMSRAKIVIAPFGYGEMAPRDIEAAQFGAVLIKPSMYHIESTPNPYKSRTGSYLKCDWEFKTLVDKVVDVLDNWGKYKPWQGEDMKEAYSRLYNPEKLVMHTYEWLTKLEGFETE